MWSTTSGTLSRDATTANQAIANDFNASTESNILALTNVAETVAQKAGWTAYNGYKQVHGSKKSGTPVAHDALGGAAGSSKSSATQLPVK
ncbi:hypothetical protein RI056_11095 [Komagataeibacter nataicola]|uniref:hypothetical protein n=1 Tax=Komagataeibacter nataicola TaxID=265960 RepID=UPI0028A7B2BB|nr:hypothetical protein [Komagataeibacter nataicola]WNM07627.1 hypothetical protein RI056_11095 [Komagataeibacter nataicola]